MKIRLAIVGYGNLGCALEKLVLSRDKDFILTGIFSRRKATGTIPLDDIINYKDLTDVVLFCGGSATDAPIIVPRLCEMGFSTVDAYDNHDNMINYRDLVSDACKASVAIIAAGWDPGYLSCMRVYNNAIMPDGIHTTFFGGETGGLSQGHSDAIRKIDGVIDARQFTHTRTDSLMLALSGNKTDKNDRHRRVCYVYANEQRKNEIENEIRNMEGYFKNQQTEINFINAHDFEKYKNLMSHSGRLISTDNDAKINLDLEMESNPRFTAKLMLAFARANYKLQNENKTGVFTPAEIPPSYLVDEITHFSNI